MIYFLLAIACKPIQLDYSSETGGCQDWDPNTDTVPTLNIYYDNDDLIVQRTGVIQHCDAEFTPVIDQMDSYKLSIREYWTNSEDVNECQTCTSPTVRLTSYPNRMLEFWWYIGDSGISFDVIDTTETE